MTAQAINGVPLDIENLVKNGSSIVSNDSEALIIEEKVGLATTLAFCVGFVQVIQFGQLNFNNISSTFCYLFLADSLVFATRFLNSLSNRTFY